MVGEKSVELEEVKGDENDAYLVSHGSNPQIIYKDQRKEVKLNLKKHETIKHLP